MRSVLLGTTFALLASAALAPRAFAQTPAPRVIPRPPVQNPQAPASEIGSAGPDGYAPVPQWAGQTRAPVPARTAAYEVQTVASGLIGAFAFHFLPDGRILLSERPGRMRIIEKDGRLSAPISGLPPLGSGGRNLFEVLPDRDFAKNRIIYFSYTALPESQVTNPPRRTPGILMVARGRLSADDRSLEDVKDLLNAEGTGGRVIQARDGTLLVTSTIPAGLGINSSDWPQPQQMDSLMGKVLRINTDGSVPPDNPFVGKSGARPEIYALGFRDDQGVAIHPRTGKLWLSEHGPRGGDEINAVDKGKNYGFPVIGYGREYTGKPLNDDRTVQTGMEQPVYFWTPDIAPAGIAFYTGKLFPAWQGDLFVGALAGKYLVRLVLSGERVVAEERLLADLNQRIRGVQQGPDESLYVMTDGNEGKLLRLVPRK
ncbi:MAG: PQQ-dependent sugar dehydrogenase [Acidobacteriota bacterium]